MREPHAERSLTFFSFLYLPGLWRHTIIRIPGETPSSVYVTNSCCQRCQNSTLLVDIILHSRSLHTFLAMPIFFRWWFSSEDCVRSPWVQLHSLTNLQSQSSSSDLSTITITLFGFWSFNIFWSIETPIMGFPFQVWNLWFSILLWTPWHHYHVASTDDKCTEACPMHITTPTRWEWCPAYSCIHALLQPSPCLYMLSAAFYISSEHAQLTLTTCLVHTSAPHYMGGKKFVLFYLMTLFAPITALSTHQQGKLHV